MSHVPEIYYAARDISLDKMMEAYRNKEMEVLKSAIEVQAEVQTELAQMLSEVMPHLGGNINLLV